MWRAPPAKRLPLALGLLQLPCRYSHTRPLSQLASCSFAYDRGVCYRGAAEPGALVAPQHILSACRSWLRRLHTYCDGIYGFNDCPAIQGLPRAALTPATWPAPPTRTAVLCHCLPRPQRPTLQATPKQVKRAQRDRSEASTAQG